VGLKEKLMIIGDKKSSNSVPLKTDVLVNIMLIISFVDKKLQNGEHRKQTW
jgi:hypothetical protein